MTAKKTVPATRERKVREEASKPATRTISRSAKTGRLVPKSEAKANPTETVTERVVVKIDRKKLVIPKTLAKAADALYTTRADRLAAQRQIQPLTDFEKLLREHIIENLPKSQANGISGQVAKAEIIKKNVPQIEDEAKFMAYARKKGNEDLVKIVPNMEAIQARWENKKVVPGVGTYTIVTVSSTKR